MSIAEFRRQLRKLGVELRVDGDNLICNAPKGVLTDELRAELTSRKAEFVTFLTTTTITGANDSQAVASAVCDGKVPLSFAQERLWYLDKLEPNTATYNLPSAVTITGKLNIEVLKKSLNEIVSRYEILRTKFAIDSGSPVQIVDSAVELELPLVDLSSLPVNEREQELQLFLKTAAQKPPDLEKGPLIGVACLRLDKQEHVLSLMTHHSVFDGSSFGLFLNELVTIYDAFAKDDVSPLADVSVQYADYAIWQRNLLEGAELKKLLKHWREQLSGQLPILAMPTDYTRPPVQSYRGTTETIELPAALANSLTQLGRSEGATLFMVMLAAFNVLLNRYTGQDDIIVGSPINGRNRSEFENAIGFFVNTLALRTDLSGEPTFSELLKRVKQSCLDAYAHQELPFEKLVQELEVERDLSRTPLFQTMFAYQDTTDREVFATDLTLKAMRVDTQTSRTDISFWITRSEQGLKAVAEYSTDLFERRTITQLLHHYQSVLAGIINDKNLPISRLPLLSLEERERMVVQWNETDATFNSRDKIHEMFEVQAKATPDAIAVVFGDDRLSYDQLNRRANQLAHHLQALGVQSQSMVGISLNRSVEMLIGLLAILKSGCAYVPLDPDFPSERLAYMMSDADIAFLVSRESVWESLPENDAVPVCIDSQSIAIAERSDENLALHGSPEDLAYVIYTSGSTGKPKGVQVPHRGVTNFLNSMQLEPGLKSSDRLLAVTTLSFDIAVLELFLPLVVGARVVIASRDVTTDGMRLLETLDAAGITVMQATPATWQLIIDAGWNDSSPIKVLCGGEAMLPELASELSKRSGSVWNLYGPTETTIWSTCAKVNVTNGPVLIGRPIANTQIYVLDRHKKPVPVGVGGEIYIGGAGVTRGYMKQPELTGERFLPDDFTAGDNLLYRTGDLGRWRLDGSIEHLGRIDSQVKVRGFRIELGEIESVLGEHASVDRVAVDVWEAAAGDQRLIAYIVVSSGETTDSIELRKHLSVRLPNYMLPQQYVALDAIPLTPNGKVDRKQLPAPPDHSGGKSRRPLETSTEKQVASIWSNLLGVEQIGKYDNFFELGGHSLLAVKAVLELEKVTGTRIELRQILFEDLFQIAQHVQPGRSEESASGKHSGGGLFSKLVGWSRRFQ